MADNRLPDSQLLIYVAPGGEAGIRVRVVAESVWLTQAQIAELFQTTRQNVSAHIANVYDEEELDHEQTSRTVIESRSEGSRSVRRELAVYNLDLILSVGYRVKSKIATQFRIWATERLVEYIVKGFTMDDERLKEGRSLGQDYFNELLQRIRDIRASEKRFYQKLRDIFALAIDYDASEQTARQFFARIQNKLLFAASGFTAAELIDSRSDHASSNMGLTSWKGSRVRKNDVDVGKNYLTSQEIDELNRIVVMYLDFAEDRARRGRPMHMADWDERLDAFLQFNEREILDDLGRVSMEVAKRTALTEYDQFDHDRRSREAIDADDADLAALREHIEGLEQADA